MEERLQTIQSIKNKKVQIGIIPGHFATNHSHVNYYVDMTSIKTSLKMAKEAAHELGSTYANTNIETIICLEAQRYSAVFLLNIFLRQVSTRARISTSSPPNSTR